MTTEIIPSGELKGIEGALAQMDQHSLSLDSLRARAVAVDVKDASSYEAAANILGEVKGIEKVGTAAMVPFDEIVKKVKDFLTQRKQRVTNACSEVRGILEGKMGEYTRRKEREDREREARERKELEERLAKENAATVKEARQEGELTKKQAEKALKEGAKQAAETAANATFKPTVGATAGVRRRVNYRAELLEHKGSKDGARQRFILAAFEEYTKLGKLGPLSAFLSVSENALAAKARELEDNEKMAAICPGTIRAWDERSF